MSSKYIYSAQYYKARNTMLLFIKSIIHLTSYFSIKLNIISWQVQYNLAFNKVVKNKALFQIYANINLLLTSNINAIFIALLFIINCQTIQ